MGCTIWQPVPTRHQCWTCHLTRPVTVLYQHSAQLCLTAGHCACVGLCCLCHSGPCYAGTKSSPRPSSVQQAEAAHPLTGCARTCGNSDTALASFDVPMGMPSQCAAATCLAPLHSPIPASSRAPLPKPTSVLLQDDPTLAAGPVVPTDLCTAGKLQLEEASLSTSRRLSARQGGAHCALPADTGNGGRPETRHVATTMATEPAPYVLTAVGHSLGGAQLLMYTVMQLRRREKHRLSRLVLLTPAGFVKKVPFLLSPISWCLPALTWMARRLFRDGLCVPFMIPTNWARSLFWDLGADLKSVPALGKLIGCACCSFRLQAGTRCPQSVASVVQVHTQ